MENTNMPESISKFNRMQLCAQSVWSHKLSLSCISSGRALQCLQRHGGEKKMWPGVHGLGVVQNCHLRLMTAYAIPSPQNSASLRVKIALIIAHRNCHLRGSWYVYMYRTAPLWPKHVSLYRSSLCLYECEVYAAPRPIANHLRKEVHCCC